MKSKHRKCKICRERLPVEEGIINGLDFVCGTDHLAELGLKRVEKQRGQKQRQDRKDLRERKQAVKTRREWIKEAQQEFNKFIRLRDAKEPCICCGEWADESWKPGGSWDAGHFKGVGAHPELRFEELNCHKQLKSCNAGEGKYSGKARTVNQGYTERLPDKIGQEAFDWLTGPHEANKYTIEDLRAIKAKYQDKCRELKKGA